MLRSHSHPGRSGPLADCRGVIRLLFTALMLLAPAFAGAGADQELQVFVRAGCPHCAAAREFLPGFARSHPGLRIVYRDVEQDAAALEELLAHSQRAGVWPPGVPTFVRGELVLVGFDSPELTARALEEMLANGAPPPTTVETGAFGTLSVATLGLPLFTLALGLLDGFNPCAMWVLLFLLAMLVHLRDRRRMALIAGTFVLVSGVIYYIFMAAWLNFFLLVGFTTAVRWTLGVMALAIGAINIKDFVAFGRGVSLSIPESAKPGLYVRMRNIINAESLVPALAAVTVLAVLVNFIELLCTAGLPAVYTAVLAQQDLGTAAYHAYLGLYILGYVADDTLMVGAAVLALSSRKLDERAGRWLKLASGAVMAMLGIVLILQPEWLAG